MSNPIETMELARVLHDVATQVFEMAMVEEPDDNTGPPRTLTWCFKQNTSTARDEGAVPTTWLSVELNLVAQSPEGADEDLVARICKALGEGRFSV